ncbi:MAG: NTP transferase domain-containing protein [Provencibacterium sp.]|nr:NTP transferase domain-containing protein [Provencibacterium sp.]
MKAVIMAGGEGSRLRPLTLDTPKPLVRLCGRPVIEYILALLERHGITDCVLSAGYLQNELHRYFEMRRPDGLSIRIVDESRPLGTAGGVKNAAGNAKEEVLVISGDALCNIDLTAALYEHRQSGAQATMVVKRVEDPREYGLVQLDENGFISGFVEKPPFSGVTTDLANTGIYILSPQALRLIPPDEKYDFAGDLFPRMLMQHRRLGAYITESYWCDIGELSSYLRCQYDLLLGKTGLPELTAGKEQGILAREKPAGVYFSEGPVYFGKGVRIGEGARIKGPCILDDGVSVGANTKIEGGVLLAGAFVGESARLCEALLCPGVSVKWGAVLHEGSAVGAHAIIGNSARVEPGVKIWPYRHAPDGTVISHHLITQSGREEIFDEEGITGEVGAELTPELLARLGCAIGSIRQQQPVAIGCSDARAGRALLSALSAGIQSSGVQVMDFGTVYRSLFNWSMAYTGSSLGVYLETDPAQGKIRLLGEHALGCPRPLERRIESFLMRGEFTRAGVARFGERIGMEGMQALYAADLLRQAPYGLSGMQAQVRSANRAIAHLLRDTLQGLGCDTGAGPVLRISSDGLGMSVSDETAGEILFGRLQCMLALAEFKQERDVALSYTAPQLIEHMATKYGRKVWRYFDCPAAEEDAAARRKAAGQDYFRDALLMSVRLLSFCKMAGTSLSGLSGEVPGYGMQQGSLPDVYAPAELMNRLSRQGTAGTQGLLLQHRLGVARIRPGKRGDCIRVFAESKNAEMAQELCADVLAYLKRLRDESAESTKGESPQKRL